MFLEYLPFDLSFDLSLFITKSENALDDIVLDLEFIVDLEVHKENQPIDEYILNSPQSSLTTAKTPKLSELVSTTLSSPLFPSTSEVHSPPPFIASLPYQPIITHQSPITPYSPSTILSSPSTSTPRLSPAQLRAMANRYAPLVLAAPLGAIPQDYQNKIFQFDGMGPYTAQHHVNKMTYYFELHEIDIGDIQMRLFAQILASDRKWFRVLPYNSIDSLDIFY